MARSPVRTFLFLAAWSPHQRAYGEWRSAAVPARHGRARMLVCCLVACFAVLQGPTPARIALTRGPPEGIWPPLLAPNRPETVPYGPPDGSRGPRRPARRLQDGPRLLLRPLGCRKMLPRRSQRPPRRFQTGLGRPKTLKNLWFFYDFQDSSFLRP